MQKLSLSIAEKLLLLRNGERIQASLLRQTIFQELLFEKILYKIGKSKGHIVLLNKGLLDLYLQNRYNVGHLDKYVASLKQSKLSRMAQNKISTDSKLLIQQRFNGFFVTCNEPVKVFINDRDRVLNPLPGFFHFVYDFEHFIPDEHVTIVGVENPENFRCIENQKHFFSYIKPLFISYHIESQRADIIHWLRSIPNPYLHFGDLDFASINIYLSEIKKNIPQKSTFFVPDRVEHLLKRYGNSKHYDKQKLHVDMTTIREKTLVELIALIHKYKKGLAQEILQGLDY